MALTVPILFQGIWANDFWRSHAGRSFTMHAMSYDRRWHQYLVFDPGTGFVRTEAEKEVARPNHKVCEWIQEHKVSAKGARCRFSVFDDATGDLVRSKEFDFPLLYRWSKYPDPGYVLNVGNRFAVACDPETVYIADMNVDTPVVNYYPSPQGGDSWPFSIGNTTRFLRLIKVPRAKSMPPTVDVELSQIEDDGTWKVINRWQAHQSVNNLNSITQLDDQIISFHPNNGTMEFRSSTDGQLITTIPTPSGLDLRKDAWFFHGPQLEVLGWTVTKGLGPVYMLDHKRWVNMPAGVVDFGELSPKNDRILWSDRDHWIVTDRTTDKVIASFNKVNGEDPEFCNDESIMLMSQGWGLTLRMVSARSSEVIKTWRPYMWVLPATMVSIIVYIAWCIAWLRTTKGTNVWLWIDLGIVCFFPIALLMTRTLCVGHVVDTNRIPFQTLQGLFAAMIFVASLWLFNKTQPIARKVVPLLICIAFVAVALSMVFANDLQLASHGLMLTGALAILFVVPSAIYQRILPTLIPGNATTTSATKPTSLRDLMILVAAFAILFASVRLTMQFRAMTSLTQLPWANIATLAAAPFIAWTVGVFDDRLVHAFGKLLAIAVLSWIVFDLSYCFIEGDWFIRFGGVWDQTIHIACTAFATTYVLSKPFWKLQQV